MKFFYLLIFIFVIGCSSTERIGDFTALTVNSFDSSEYEVLGKFESEEKYDIKSAVEDCLEKGKGDLLINAVIEYQNGVFTEGYIVRGDVCKKR
ncbi:hypothetical protein [Candidatus Uabimicrobium sp. HlEnr_7]|uniref:hypothetical protein n=1 Tax=Candidatus Uabimicrobium helgolandensis TaxID=3095367 RepID=UPI00355707E7